jgi:antitoxin ParD1/3/4
MTTLTISLPDSLKQFIEREVDTGGYGNVSEYVRSLLREAQQREADRRVEALLMEGLNSGGEVAVSQEFWRDLRRDAAAILVKQRKSGKTSSTK